MTTDGADAVERSVRTLAERLDVHLDDLGVLRRALTHRSWAFENGGVEPNERLEFLGDAVLGLVVTDEIFHAHPDEQEGRLAKVRSAAVKTGSLADVARGIGLGPFILLGVGEAASGGADKDSILADTLEAVLGAVYVDQGFATAYDLVERLFADMLADLAERGAALDYKTSLQELTAANFEVLPRYHVTDTGPDHHKSFTASVAVDGEVVGTGEGRNKKQAEQRAAREAYRVLSERLRDDDGGLERPA
jgi:ribonuclease III